MEQVLSEQAAEVLSEQPAEQLPYEPSIPSKNKQPTKDIPEAEKIDNLNNLLFSENDVSIKKR